MIVVASRSLACLRPSTEKLHAVSITMNRPMPTSRVPARPDTGVSQASSTAATAAASADAAGAQRGSFCPDSARCSTDSADSGAGGAVLVVAISSPRRTRGAAR